MNHISRVCRHTDIDPCRQSHKFSEFAFTDNVVWDKNISETSISHNFCFADLLTCDAYRTSIHLHLSNGRDFVSLNVWTIGNPVLTQIGLQTGNICFESVNIYNGNRRLQFIDAHTIPSQQTRWRLFQPACRGVGYPPLSVLAWGRENRSHTLCYMLRSLIDQ